MPAGLGRRESSLACAGRGLALTNKPVLDCTGFGLISPVATPLGVSFVGALQCVESSLGFAPTVTGLVRGVG